MYFNINIHYHIYLVNNVNKAKYPHEEFNFDGREYNIIVWSQYSGNSKTKFGIAKSDRGGYGT